MKEMKLTKKEEMILGALCQRLDCAKAKVEMRGGKIIFDPCYHLFPLTSKKGDSQLNDFYLSLAETTHAVASFMAKRGYKAQVAFAENGNHTIRFRESAELR